MEAILLGGGKAERLGDAADGRPKPLADVAGRPLAAYMVARLAAAGVRRVLVACSAGTGEAFTTALHGLGTEIVPVEEPEPLGRGGGLRHAAARREGDGPILAANGDELLDVDFGALLATHEHAAAAATVTVAPLRSPFGVVDVDGDRVVAFREAPELPYWVNCGVYVLGREAIGRLPERGDHERTTFPDLAAEGKLAVHRHAGVWLTVNTPKDLRTAAEHVAAHPEWLAP